jgi:hypothetical protein
MDGPRVPCPTIVSAGHPQQLIRGKSLSWLQGRLCTLAVASWWPEGCRRSMLTLLVRPSTASLAQPAFAAALLPTAVAALLRSEGFEAWSRQRFDIIVGHLEDFGCCYRCCGLAASGAR